MAERISKLGLAGAVACFFSLVIVNNLTDYSTNFAFVQHILAMDTIFADSTLKWRSITNPTLQHAFYWAIIAMEMGIASLTWIGVVQMGQAIRGTASEFNQAKFYTLLGLTASCLLWFFVFLGVGGEWFVMWQSPIWNGQPIASRMFTITMLILLFLRQPDLESE